MSKPWTLAELKEVAKMSPGFFANNPELAAYVQEQNLIEHPWEADPDWEAKDEAETEKWRARLVATKMRKAALIQEYEERFGHSYYG
jgi:hypothetical protein